MQFNWSFPVAEHAPYFEERKCFRQVLQLSGVKPWDASPICSHDDL
jgi:hypothetical protein